MRIWQITTIRDTLITTCQSFIIIGLVEHIKEQMHIKAVSDFYRYIGTLFMSIGPLDLSERPLKQIIQPLAECHVMKRASTATQVRTELILVDIFLLPEVQ